MVSGLFIGDVLGTVQKINLQFPMEIKMTIRQILFGRFSILLIVVTARCASFHSEIKGEFQGNPAFKKIMGDHKTEDAK